MCISIFMTGKFCEDWRDFKVALLAKYCYIRKLIAYILDFLKIHFSLFYLLKRMGLFSLNVMMLQISQDDLVSLSIC